MQLALRWRGVSNRLLKPAGGWLRGGLRNRIILWAFVPTAIILATVGLVSLYTYQLVTEDLVMERDRDLTRLSASKLAADLASYTNPFSDQFLAIFESSMVVFDARGKVLAAEPESMEGWGPDWYKRFPFRHMARSVEPVFSDIVIDGRRGEKTVAAFVPIMDLDGESVGGIGVVYRLGPASSSALATTIEGLRRDGSTCIYLVDGKGQVLHHSNPDFIGEDFSEQIAVQRVLGGSAGSFRTRDRDGREIVASFAPVPNTSWGLVTEECWATLTQASRRYGRFLLSLLAVGMALPTLMLTFGVRRIMRPIAEMTNAAQEVAGGNFDQRITTATGDELEELATQFNLMASQLQESYDHLESQVANRTKELATLNTLAAVVSRSLNLDDILKDALDEALAIMGLSKGQAFLLDEDSQSLTLMAHRGLSDELVLHTTQLPLGSNTSGLAAREGRPVVRRVADYPESRFKRLVQREGVQQVISAPLMAKGKTVGAIDLGSSGLHSLSPEQLSLLAAIGHQIGVAVENARLYEQAHQLAIMEERSRLARDLHDAVTQTLFSASLIAQTMPAVWENDRGEGRRLLMELRRLTRAALAEMRALLLELRPAALAETSLDHLLRQIAETVTGRTGEPVEVTAEEDLSLPDDVHVALYRIAQEALNNVVKHAQASQVLVSLQRASPAGERQGASSSPASGQHTPGRECGVELHVRDNGRGFAPGDIQPGEMGLGIMRERARAIGAELQIESQLGAGTHIGIVWRPDE
jgi:nitrate/nitrite-specific signal transduction histidine kinase